MSAIRGTARGPSGPRGPPRVGLLNLHRHTCAPQLVWSSPTWEGCWWEAQTSAWPRPPPPPRGLLLAGRGRSRRGFVWDRSESRSTTSCPSAASWEVVRGSGRSRRRGAPSGGPRRPGSRSRGRAAAPALAGVRRGPPRPPPRRRGAPRFSAGRRRRRRGPGAPPRGGRFRRFSFHRFWFHRFSFHRFWFHRFSIEREVFSIEREVEAPLGGGPGGAPGSRGRSGGSPPAPRAMGRGPRLAGLHLGPWAKSSAAAAWSPAPCSRSASCSGWSSSTPLGRRFALSTLDPRSGPRAGRCGRGGGVDRGGVRWGAGPWGRGARPG